jgi:hypothetical protein
MHTTLQLSDCNASVPSAQQQETAIAPNLSERERQQREADNEHEDAAHAWMGDGGLGRDGLLLRSIVDKGRAATSRGRTDNAKMQVKHI